MSASPPKDIAKHVHQMRLADHIFMAVIVTIVTFVVVLLTSVELWQGIILILVVFLGLSAQFLLRAKLPILDPRQIKVEQQIGSLNRVSTILNALPEPVIVMRRDGTVEVSNPATTSFLGEIAEGQHISALMRAPKVHQAVKKALETDQSQLAEFTLTGSISRACRAFVTLIKEADDTDNIRILLFITDLSNEKSLEQMRTDFIANASHELRTPLTSLLGFIETLRGHAKDDPVAQDKFLGIMQSQAERMLRLVRDLMSLSSIELNEHVMPETRIDLFAIARDVAASLEPVAETAQGKLTVVHELEDQPAMIMGDRDQLIQVVQNLADNALKYAGPNPDVTIRIGKGIPPTPGPDALRTGEPAALISARAGVDIDEVVYIQVIDKGRGIDRDDLPRLTERFYRADAEDSKARGGTGLGLAIVKHIINRHKGGILIETSEGHGSAFTCFLIQDTDAKNTA